MRLLEGYSTLYTSLGVRVSRIGAKLVCLSATSKQAKVALECCHAVQGWKWKYPLTINIEWDYNYYQPWSDNEWLVDEMLTMLDEDMMMQ